MAELISAKDLPATEAEEVDVLCVDNGELKRKQAKGLGGAGSYVIRVPLSDFNAGDDANSPSVILSESYNNFAQFLYEGGNVMFDLSEIYASMGDFPQGAVAYGTIGYWTYIPSMGIVGAINLGGEYISFEAANGTWTPPTE